MEVFKNRNFTKRDYECTNVVAAVAPSLEAIRNPENWFRTDAETLIGLSQLWTERGVTYYGYM